MTKKVLSVVGARPNFMKIAAIMEELRKHSEFELVLLHTGQHYDESMSKTFFDELEIPRPDIYLGIGSGNPGEQTGKIMIEFERCLLKEAPDLVIVVGDVNSTMASGMVAAKHGVKLAHVEAGLRSFDRSMPEEINRVLTDQISDYLFVTERSAIGNLRREGISADKIYFVGNVMIDTLLKFRERAEKSTLLRRLGLEVNEYTVLTLHRPSNVDNRTGLESIFQALGTIQEEIPIVFPVHPRTRKQLIDLDLFDQLCSLPGMFLLEPLGYLDFIKLISNTRFVLTDSGGIQEETTILGVPCLTLRENTERPVTVEEGTNLIVGSDKDRIIRESFSILSGDSATDNDSIEVGISPKRPQYWDGKSAKRIVEVLHRDLCERYRAVA